MPEDFEGKAVLEPMQPPVNRTGFAGGFDTERLEPIWARRRTSFDLKSASGPFERFWITRLISRRDRQLFHRSQPR